MLENPANSPLILGPFCMSAAIAEPSGCPLDPFCLCCMLLGLTEQYFVPVNGDEHERFVVIYAFRLQTGGVLSGNGE